MEISQFLEQWAGRWFAQRTSYPLNQSAITNSKAELTVEFLPSNTPEVVQLCQASGVEPSLSLGGLKVSWDNAVDWGKNPDVGSNCLVFLTTGQFLHANFSGSYALGQDGALTLTVDTPELSSSERIWFASPNLKMRTVLTSLASGDTHTAFYTEIRKVSTS